MIQNPSLQIVLAYLRLQFYQLIVTNYAIYVVSQLVIASGFQIDHSRQQLVIQTVQTLLSERDTEFIVIESELCLCCDPICFLVEGFEHNDFFEMLSDFKVFLSMEVDYHAKIVDI